MPHLTRVFNPETRALTTVERKYAGQVGDSLSTVLHFEYTQLDFLLKHTPYIMFSTLDDDGNPLVFGPAPPEWLGDEDRVPFDGMTFNVPWAVTSRTKNSRVDYQLFFVKEGVEFDGRDVAKLKPTEVILSVVDSIVLKRSITCKSKNPCSCPPMAPTGAEPNVIGYISLWKDYGMVVPVSTDSRPELSETELCDCGAPECACNPSTEQTYIDDPEVMILKFRTYNGTNDQELPLERIPVMKDGKIQYYQLPFGNEANKVPLLRGIIEDGQSIVYDAASGGFVAYDILGIYQFRGIATDAQLDEMESSRIGLNGKALRNGDTYSCTERRAYDDGTGRVEYYEEGTNWVWSEQERWEPLTGELDLNRYQLKKYLVTKWDNPTDEQYPSAKLVKDSLDAKLDDSQILRSLQDPAEDVDPQKTMIYSANVVKKKFDLIDRIRSEDYDHFTDRIAEERQHVDKVTADLYATKTDKTMAIPEWDPEATYGMGSTVIFNGTVFISESADNLNNPPVVTETVDGEEMQSPSEHWSMIQGGGGTGGTAERWLVGGKQNIDIVHNFGTKDLFVVVRRVSDGTFVHVETQAVRPGTIRLKFSEAPARNSMYVTVSPAVPAQPDTTDYTIVEIGSDTKEWRGTSKSNRIVTVQTFDQSGYELVGEVRQNEPGTVVVTFNKPCRGTMILR